jgi:hypothetical protein
VTAIGIALRERGVAVDPESAVAAARAVLADNTVS